MARSNPTVARSVWLRLWALGRAGTGRTAGGGAQGTRSASHFSVSARVGPSVFQDERAFLLHPREFLMASKRWRVRTALRSLPLVLAPDPGNIGWQYWLSNLTAMKIVEYSARIEVNLGNKVLYHTALDWATPDPYVSAGFLVGWTSSSGATFPNVYIPN